MKAVVASEGQLHEASHRLDASYHASEGVKALRFFQQWAGQSTAVPPQTTRTVREPVARYSGRRLDKLSQVADIFNGPRFARTYVADRGYGVPFLSSSDMLHADLGSVKLLSRRLTPSALLDAIRVSRGWTLISCSGTIGNTTYVRSDMDGMTASQHIMRVVPKDEAIPAGYLYTFLSSGIGYALVTQGTYGAVVQHIEPQHITDLPIPRIAPATEQRIHELIERAAALRVEAAEYKQEALQLTSSLLGVNLSAFEPSTMLTVLSSRLDWRLEGAYHAAREAAQNIFYSSNVNLVPIGDLLLDMFYLGKLHRVFVDDPNYGVPLLSIADAQRAKLASEKFVSRTQSRNVAQAILQEGWVLVSRVGTPGLVTYTRREMVGMAGTDHLVRLVPNTEKVLPGYLFSILASALGYGLLVGSVHGSVQMVLPPEYIARIKIPLLPLDDQRPIHESIEHYTEALTEASEHEDEAQALLVNALGYGDGRIS